MFTVAFDNRELSVEDIEVSVSGTCIENVCGRDNVIVVLVEFNREILVINNASLLYNGPEVRSTKIVDGKIEFRVFTNNFGGIEEEFEIEGIVVDAVTVIGKDSYSDNVVRKTGTYIDTFGIQANELDIDNIDPNNNNRILVEAGGNNRTGLVQHGIYLSEDMGDTYEHVLSQAYGEGQLELKNSLCWDGSSYDEEIGGSAVAYWAKNYWLKAPAGWESKDPERNLEVSPNEQEGLWKTIDGGYTWEVVNPDFYDAVVAVHPETGVLYAGNKNGFFRSEDGGVTFENILSGSGIWSIDVIPTHPDNVYINDFGGVLISEDSGKTFKRIESKNFPESVDKSNPYKSVRNLKVNPVEPKNMLIAFYSGFGAYDSRIYYSNDGGVTWARSAEDYT